LLFLARLSPRESGSNWPQSLFDRKPTAFDHIPDAGQAGFRDHGNDRERFGTRPQIPAGRDKLGAENNPKYPAIVTSRGKATE